MNCPACGRPLRKIKGVVQPPPPDGHRAAALLLCGSCNVRYLEEFTEFRVEGRMETGDRLYPLDAQQARDAEYLIRACSQPQSASCACPAHPFVADLLTRLKPISSKSATED